MLALAAACGQKGPLILPGEQQTQGAPQTTQPTQQERENEDTEEEGQSRDE